MIDNIQIVNEHPYTVHTDARKSGHLVLGTTETVIKVSPYTEHMTKVAIIGTGFGAKVHLPAFQHHPDFEVVGIAGRNPQKTREIAEAAGIAHTTDWRDFLHGDAELIAVTTPPYLHYEMGKEVLYSNKHLLLEKPTTTTALQARELLTIAEERGLVGMLSHEFRWMPPRRTLTNVVQANLGEITEVHVDAFMSFASSRDSPLFGWLWDSRFDGGILGALGSHLIDQIRTTADMEITELSGRLFTRTSHRRTREGEYARVTADDGFLIDFSFENGASGMLNASTTLRTAPETRYVFSGENGVAMLVGNEVLLALDGGEFQPVEIPAEFELKDIGGDRRIMPYLTFLDEVSASVRDGVSYSPSLYDGWRNQQVLDAVRLSHSTGNRVRIQ